MAAGGNVDPLRVPEPAVVDPSAADFDCDNCHDSGVVFVRQRVGVGAVFERELPCPTCRKPAIPTGGAL